MKRPATPSLKLPALRFPALVLPVLCWPAWVFPFVMLLALLLPAILFQGCTPQTVTFSSPDGQVRVTVAPGDSGIMYYSVSSEAQQVLEPSRLGLVRKDADFSKDLVIREIHPPRTISESYTVLTEKQKDITYTANSQTLTVENPSGETMDIEFRVFASGVGFRYLFPDSSEQKKTILREVSSFNLPDSARAWLHPHMHVRTGWCNTQPSYEENYFVDVPTGTPAPEAAGWSFPALFRTGEKWVWISESGVDPSYCGARLGASSPGGVYTIAFAQPLEQTIDNAPPTPEWTLPWSTPWRIISVGTLKTVVENTLVTDLAQPAMVQADFARPGIASWSWGLLKDESVNFDTQKAFIDYSARMGWPYCLIDVEWDTRIGEAALLQLISYARSLNVGVILWYNSAGPWNTTVYTPRDKMFLPEVRQAEMARLKSWGVAGIKVDFWPGDGQTAIRYYYDLFRDAAEAGLMVNCHGTTLPRGWGRTFPNLMTMESVKGFEFITFEQANTDKGPVHCAILPFTRNIAGPMDFTPVCFGEIPGRERRTTNGFEIALSVLFQSGIQHIVETPASMALQPDFVVDFMKRVPAGWDQTLFIDGFPGKYVVMARRAGERWYVGGINAQQHECALDLDLSDLNVSKGICITEGAGNRDFSKSDITLDGGRLHLTLRPMGGFVLEF